MRLGDNTYKSSNTGIWLKKDGQNDQTAKSAKTTKAD